jgi:hypothetical protein
MKRIIRMLTTLCFLALLSSCGSATEVGNPTGEVPTQTLFGWIDLTTLSADVAAQKETSITGLTVLASASATSEIEAPVDAAGAFEIEVRVEQQYEWQVRSQGIKLGDFSFEQDDGISRGNRLTVRTQGDPFDMGRIQHIEGLFVPENDPGRYQHRTGQQSGGSGSGSP